MISDKIISLIKKKFPSWQGIILINSTSKFDAIFAADSPFEDAQTGSFDLNYVASLISIRYKLADFEKVLDGLSTTINIFGKFMMFVSHVGEELFVLILPRNENITDVYETFSEVAKHVSELRYSQNTMKVAV